MAILLIAEHDNASLSDQTAKALTAALKIGSDVHVLVAGKGAKAAADAAAKLGGVSKVLLAEADELENRLAEIRRCGGTAKCAEIHLEVGAATAGTDPDDRERCRDERPGNGCEVRSQLAGLAGHREGNPADGKSQ